jgi:hypothetical protein
MSTAATRWTVRQTIRKTWNNWFRLRSKPRGARIRARPRFSPRIWASTSDFEPSTKSC